jgi:hypothetical protein
MSIHQVNRRGLLLGAAATTFAAALPGQDEEKRKIRSLVAEGIATADTVVGQAPLILPQAIIDALMNGSQLRVRIEYPDPRKTATFYGFLAGPADPLPLPRLALGDPRIFTVLRFEVQETLVAFSPQPAFTMLGRVAEETIPSPFFSGLLGRVAGITAGFQNEGQTTFTMLGGFVAGSHASYARVAYGTIDL